MKKIKVATSNTRGFLKNLFDYKFDDIEFLYECKSVYEVPSLLKKILTQMITWPIFDILGIFQVISDDGEDADILFSYNRFLKTQKPYVIFLENPSALVNYCWDRPSKFIAKKKLKKRFEDRNLRAIVCMSKACYMYFDNLYDRPQNVDLLQVYPYIQDDYHYNEKDIDMIVNEKIIECVFVSSDFELKGGRDLIEVFSYLESNDYPIHITLITRKSSIRMSDYEKIQQLNNMSVVEFALTKEELNEYYKKAAIIINPTRRDSFSLVTLEAIKYGCAVIATDVYAIKEMDIDGVNGYITQSMFQIWDAGGYRNKYDRTHPKKTVMSGCVDWELVYWMRKKLIKLILDRELLMNMCVNSLKLARETSFSGKRVIEEWKEIFMKIQI